MSQEGRSVPVERKHYGVAALHKRGFSTTGSAVRRHGVVNPQRLNHCQAVNSGEEWQRTANVMRVPPNSVKSWQLLQRWRSRRMDQSVCNVVCSQESGNPQVHVQPSGSTEMYFCVGKTSAYFAAAQTLYHTASLLSPKPGAVATQASGGHRGMQAAVGREHFWCDSTVHVLFLCSMPPTSFSLP